MSYSRILHGVAAVASVLSAGLLEPCSAMASSVDNPRVLQNQGGYPSIGSQAQLRNPIFNRGLAFSAAFREKHALAGLMPAGERSFELQEQLALANFREKREPLDKYSYLQGIQNIDERLFFALLTKHTSECMPFVYTPTVGAACQAWSNLYLGAPRGLYLSINERGRIGEILQRYAAEHPPVKAIVVTDGERILGLGDLGANGMGIPIGKLALYTACAGVDPAGCLPVHIDVGTNNAKLLEDPYYVGLKQERLRGPEYDALIDEFIQGCKTVFGQQVLVQFEDFGNTNAFRLLEHYQDKACCFNDDIQGTASVCLAGILASQRISERALADNTFLFLGAGEAGVGIAELISMAISKETGKSVEEARQQIWLIDSKGLVHAGRLADPRLAGHKKPYAHALPAGIAEFAGTNKEEMLVDAIRNLKPSGLIGVSAQPESFTQTVCETMAAQYDKPLIFALSNPTSKAECTAEQAYTFTGGNCIFASGSPFSPVTLPNGKSFVPGQGNNAYVFPGLGLAAIAAGAKHVTDGDMYTAAQELARLVPQDRIEVGCVYPSLDEIRSVSAHIAAAVCADMYERGDATVLPRPADLLAHCQAQMYDPLAPPASL